MTEWVRKIQAYHPVAQYLLALAGTIFAYGLYALLVVPVLEGEPLQRATRNLVPAAPRIIDREKIDLATWLPPGSWELGSCKTLETAEGTIYFQDYLPREDGILEVFPFTMVFREERGGRAAIPGGRNPMIIRASRRAELKFERQVTWSGDPGRVEGGQLQGNVQLFRVPRSTHPDEGFSVWTENIQLTASRVSTIEQVEFQFGRHRGSGRNLVLDLAHKTPLELAQQDLSHISGVKRLELAFVEDLKLDLTNGAKAAAGQPADLVDVSCAGPFVFDFENLRASFKEQVLVKQLAAAGDTLSADQLDLLFNQVQALGDASQVAAEGSRSGKLELRSIVARGAPAIVSMPSREVRVKAAELEYDLQAGHVRARDPQMVEVRQAGQLVRAPQLDYRMREDGAMGTLLAEGAGLFARTDRLEQGGERTSVVQWSRQLSISQVSGGKLISVDGDADVRLDSETRVTGEQLQMLLAEQRLVETLPPEIIASGKQPKETWDYQPSELQVNGNVRITTRQMEGQTPKLKARWLANTELLNPVPLMRQSNRSRPQPASWAKQVVETQFPVQPVGSAGQDTGGLNSAAGWANTPRITGGEQPARDGMPASSGLASSDSVKAAALQFRGREVTATLQQLGNQTELRQLDIDGDVEVFQAGGAKPESGWSLTGGHLTLIPQGQELHRMSLSREARVVTEQMELTGPELQLDQAANRLWSNGAGRAKLRPNASAKQDKAGGELSAITASEASNRNQEIEIEWLGGMIFDGEKVYFEHAVQSAAVETRPDGTQTVLRTRSEGLNLLLDRPMNLRQLDAGSTAGAGGGEMKIKQIVLVDRIPGNGRAFQVSQPLGEHRPVLLEKYSVSPAGMMLDKQQINVPRIVMELETGDVTANGPGELLQWKPGGSGSGGGGLTSPLAREREAGQPAREGLEYMHCRFDENLQANTNRTEMRINGRVRAMVAAVADWEQRLDPDAERVPERATRISCDQVQIVQWTPRGSDQPTTEILANSNARIVGSNFEATAERLSYNERTDLLVIEGDGRQDANLWFQQQPGAKRDHLVAGKILYRPGDQWTQIEKVRNATINQGR